MTPPPLVSSTGPSAIAPPPLFLGGVGAVVPRPSAVGAVAPVASPTPGPAFSAAPPVPVAPPSVVAMPARSESLAGRVLVGFLVTFHDEPSGTFWAIRSGRSSIGRVGADASIDIGIGDSSASSRHASIHADPATGLAFVEDEGSRNGTFVNELRLSRGERRQLHDNDRLRVGGMTLVVKLLVS